MKTYTLELIIRKVDGTEIHDFCHQNGESRDKAIATQTRSFNFRIQKAKAGNPIWASNSDDYANWKSFEMK